jgi:hypothetical protein
MREIDRRSRNSHELAALFIDFSSAYDRVDRRVLMELVKERKLLSTTEV